KTDNSHLLTRKQSLKAPFFRLLKNQSVTKMTGNLTKCQNTCSRSAFREGSMRAPCPLAADDAQGRRVPVCAKKSNKHVLTQNNTHCFAL
ncbi:MAG: hypothetical protein ACI350_10475, partial [Prevotella sp.]